MAESGLPEEIRAHIEGDVSGQIAIGNNILQIGAIYGGVVNISTPEAQPLPKPRPSPVILRPRPFPDILDRNKELGSVHSGLDSGLPVEFHGEAGIGKTTLLRHLAHHLPLASFPDGVVYLAARDQPAEDILQALFDSFYECDVPFKPTNAQARHALQGKRALILLDDLELEREDVQRLTDMAPGCSFLLAARERHLWGEGRAEAMGGLPLPDAMRLVERELDRSLTEDECSAAERICKALNGHPLRILQATAMVREDYRSLEEVASHLVAASSAEELTAEVSRSASEEERRVLAALAFLRGTAVEAEQLAGLTEIPDIVPILQNLQRRNLVRAEGNRYRITRGLIDEVLETTDVKFWGGRALEYFGGWAEENRHAPDRLAANSGAILQTLRWASEAGLSGDALLLAEAVDGPLALSGRWGTWERVLRWSLESARAIGDQAAEAWALHQYGTRALCLEDAATASSYLGKALELRQSLGDQIGAAITRNNLETLHISPPLDQGPSADEDPSGDEDPSSEQEQPTEAEPSTEVEPGEPEILEPQQPLDAGPAEIDMPLVSQPLPAPPVSSGLSLMAKGAIVLSAVAVGVLVWQLAPVFLAPVIEMSGTTVDFGDRPVGTSAEDQTVEFSNIGWGSIVFGELTLAGDSEDFLVADSCAGATVGRNSACTMTISFVPRATGPRSATITISHDAGDAYGVSLNGVGTQASVELDPTVLEFGDLLLRTGGLERRASLTNRGTASLTIQDVTLEGAADFTLIPGGEGSCRGATVAPGEGCEMRVEFAPGAVGGRSGTLAIHHDAPEGPHSVLLSGTGTDPEVSLGRDAVGFGDQLIRTVSTRESLRVANTGTGPLVIESVDLAGENTGDFRLVEAPGANRCQDATLAPTEECEIEVEFSPRGTELRGAAITIRHTAVEGSHSVPLTGRGIEPVASIEPGAIEFGDQLLGTTSSRETIVVANSGTGPLVIESIDLTGQSEGDFGWMDALGAEACPGATLAPGEECEIVVEFRPIETAIRSATITIEHSAVDSPHAIEMRGRGTEPIARISPARLNFEGIRVDRSSPVESVTVTNEGTGPLIIALPDLTGPDMNDFSAAGDCTREEIAPGRSCTIDITFTPSNAGERSARLTIAYNATNSPQAVELSGVGTAPVFDISSRRVDFGDQPVETPSEHRVISIGNTGNGPLTIRRASLSGTDSNDFEYGTDCTGRTIMPEARPCIIEVTFIPRADRARTATLTFVHDAPGSPASVELTGRGTVAAIAVDPPRLEFGEVELVATLAPQPRRERIRISNEGSAPLTIAAIEIGGANASDFSVVESCAGTTIAPGRSCDLSVGFRATGAGNRGAEMMIHHNGGRSPHIVPLSGAGRQMERVPDVDERRPLEPPPPSAPRFELRARRLDFGNQRVRTRSEVRPVTIHNPGSGPLEIRGITFEGAAANDFGVDLGNCSSRVPAGGACAIEVWFVPTAIGDRTAALVIAHNAEGGPATVGVRGNGINEAVLVPEFLCPDPAAERIDFAIVSRGSPADGGGLRPAQSRQQEPLQRRLQQPPQQRLQQPLQQRPQQRFRGRVRITGVIRNVGRGVYESGPGQQQVVLYEIPLGGQARQVAVGRFQNLAPGQETTVVYERDWNASSPSEGEFPPSYRLAIVYGPDIRQDNNRQNDECTAENNQIERSGAAINEMFRGLDESAPTGRQGSESSGTTRRKATRDRP